MVTLLMSLALSACSPAVDRSKPLPFELRQNGIIVPVRVSGQGPFRFLLDTGASRSVIASRVAGLVGAVASAQTRMLTPVGHSVRPTARVTLQLGERGNVIVTATLLRDEELTRGGRDVDGIIGQDVLAPLVYTIDYQRRVIDWGPVTTVAPALRLALDFVDGRALVTVPAQRGVSEPLRLIPDSGADGFVLFAGRGRSLPALTLLHVGMLRTLAGQQLVRAARIDRLDIGGVILREPPAVVLADAGHGWPHGDGLLPLHVFARVTFHGPEGYMLVAR